MFIITVSCQPTSSSMFCSTVLFTLRERTCNIYLWMEFDLHEYNRTQILPGVVGTAINGTIRLQSDFEVRYSSLNPIIYIILMIYLTAGSWSSHSMYLAILRTWVVSKYQSLMIIWTDQSPVNHELMINSFAAAFYKMGLLGQAKNRKVSNRWCILKVYPSH